MGVVGILLSLLLLMYLAYRDVSVILLAPVCALLAVLLDGDTPMLAAYTQIFMGAVGKFVVSYFPLFLLGAVFGKLMDDSGCVMKLASLISRVAGPERAILSIVISCGILTYGGVSLFVIVFTVFPLCSSLFRQAGLPRRLIPAAIALGSFTFTMTALPGSVQIQNMIPMKYFGTTSFAAPGLGCIGGAIMFLLGMLWLNLQAARARQRGEGFDGPVPNPGRETPEFAAPSAGSVSSSASQHSVTAKVTDAGTGSIQSASEDQAAALPSAWSAFAPLACVIVLNFVFSQYVLPGWKTEYLAEAKFGSTDIERVRGLWSTILAMVSALLLTIVLHYRCWERLKKALATGAQSSLLPVFNTASEFGYGSTIAALAAFATVRQAVVNIAPGNPLVSEMIAVNAMAGITGSASGGLGIALEALGSTFLQRGVDAGIDPQLLHRIASMSCGGLDSLPHNGALITLLIICGSTHRQSYRDVAVVSIVCPFIATVAVLILGTMLGTF